MQPKQTNGTKIDTALPVKQRIERYLGELDNPYGMRCGDVAVTLEFAENGKPLDRLLVEYFTNSAPTRKEEAQP